MRNICERARVYTTLFVMVSFVGTVICSITAYLNFPQYTYNFIYGVVITVYMMENWSLLVDLDQSNENSKHEKAHIEIINMLTLTNNKLVTEITILKEDMKKHRAADERRIDESIQSIKSIQSIQSIQSIKSNHIETLRNKWNDPPHSPPFNFSDCITNHQDTNIIKTPSKPCTACQPDQRQTIYSSQRCTSCTARRQPSS